MSDSLSANRERAQRYLRIDALRALALLGMIAFHFCYDVFEVYGRAPGWYDRPAVYFWQQSICWTFILLSGFSWRWGKRHNLRRGLFLNACGLLVTLVTFLTMPEVTVRYGILTFMGCAVLLLIPLDRCLQRVPPPAGALGSFLLFLICRPIADGYLGVAGWKLLTLPEALYQSKALAIFGFPYAGFSSGDYFPLLPWLFLFVTGYFLAPLLLRSERVGRWLMPPVPLLSAMGQKSIWIYLIHQPLCMLLAALLFGRS